MAPRLIRKFSETMDMLSRGDFSRKCDEKLSEVIAALEATPDQKGRASVTITIDFTYLEGRARISPKAVPSASRESSTSSSPMSCASAAGAACASAFARSSAP